MSRPHPPGMIGIPTGNGILRSSELLPSMMQLIRPEGTKFKNQDGLGVALPLNIICDLFMKDKSLEWLFLTNDDNILPPDTLMRLLDDQVEVVTGLYLGRQQPFLPVLFDRILTAKSVEPGAPFRPMSNRWYSRKFMDGNEPELEPTIACGDGCLLIRRKVFEVLIARFGGPWWEYGETVSDACDHDMVLCRKIRDAGFQIWCDTTVRVDHVAQIRIRPHRNEDGSWTTRLVQADGMYIELPAAKRPEKE